VFEEIEHATGFRPIVYISEEGINALKGNVGSLPARELWLKKYWIPPKTNKLPPLPMDKGDLIFPHWSIWQYSEKGSVPGISGNVDLDLYNGNSAHLSQWIQTEQPGGH
jgi:lysozyme